MINPDAEEICCNSEDDNCDGQVDEGCCEVCENYCQDADKDGYGDPNNTKESCTQPDGYVGNCDDCNDSDPDLPTNYCLDADEDGYGDKNSDAKLACEQPDGHVGNCDDCDDTDPLIPGAEEICCNNKDDNCDGQVDEGCCEVCENYCFDTDGDGYGDPNITKEACTQPDGYIGNCDDCDDSDSTVPAPEICNEKDDDCDGETDESSECNADDSSEQASIITLNAEKPQHHNFHAPDDEDWFVFYGVSGQSYTIEVSDPEADCDPVTELYDADRTANIAPVNEEEGQAGTYAWTCAKDGPYYVKIKNSNPDVSGYRTEYSFQIFRPHPCATRTVTGIISDKFSEEPVGSALIRTDQKDTAISGEDGHYEMIFCSSSVNMTVEADGYYTALENLESTGKADSADSFTLDVILEPVVTLSDAILILRILTEQQSVETFTIDINNDGKSGLEEVIYILRRLTGF